MTIEMEKRDLLNRTKRKQVLNPGNCIEIEGQSLIRPTVHIQVVSEDEVHVFRSFGNEMYPPQSLVREDINTSRDTYRYLSGIKISWKPSHTLNV